MVVSMLNNYKYIDYGYDKVDLRVNQYFLLLIIESASSLKIKKYIDGLYKAGELSKF